MDWIVTQKRKLAFCFVIFLQFHIPNNKLLQVLFPIFKEHHEQIEEQAEKAKLTIKEKLESFFKKEKSEKVEKEAKKAEKAAKELKDQSKKEWSKAQ